MKPTCLILLGFLALAGCSDETPTFADAAPGPDGAPDPDGPAADPDAGPDGPPGTDVTVHVTTWFGDGQADVGAVVYFADVDGAIVATRTVDATGVVTAPAAPGGSVTVQPSGILFNQLVTVAAIEGGDDLWFGRTPVMGAGQMTVTFPADPGAANYLISGPCVVAGAITGTTATVFLVPGCAATRPIVVAADQDDGTYRYLVKLDATPVDGATLALTGPWLEPVLGARTTVANLPAGATAFSAGAFFTAGGWRLGGPVYPVDSAADPIELEGPPGIDEGVIVSTLYTAPGTADAINITRHVSPIPAAPVVVDATPAVADITDLVVTGDTFTWTRGAGPADAIVFQAEEPDPKGTGGGGFWVFITSADAGRLALPAIPDAPPVVFDTVQVFDLDVVDGYGAFRPRAGMGTWLWDLPAPLPPFTLVARSVDGF